MLITRNFINFIQNNLQLDLPFDVILSHTLDLLAEDEFCPRTKKNSINRLIKFLNYQYEFIDKKKKIIHIFILIVLYF